MYIAAVVTKSSISKHSLGNTIWKRRNEAANGRDTKAPARTESHYLPEAVQNSEDVGDVRVICQPTAAI